MAKATKPETALPQAPAEKKLARPPCGGSFTRDPESGELKRQGGTKPSTHRERRQLSK